MKERRLVPGITFRNRKRHVLTIFRKELGFVMVWT